MDFSADVYKVLVSHVMCSPIPAKDIQKKTQVCLLVLTFPFSFSHHVFARKQKRQYFKRQCPILYFTPNF